MTASPMVVVGGGIVGSAIARQLQRNGTRTILVERDVEPQGASYFSFASLSAFADPNADRYALKCLGMSDWRRWSREISGDIGLRWDGELRWAEGEASAVWLRQMIEVATHRGYSVQELSEREIVERLPASRPSNVRAASFAPDDGQVDAAVAVARLREDFMAAGGSLLVGRATLRFDESDLYVRVASDELRADKVVLAMGAETHGFLDQLGWSVPVEARPGMLVATEPMDSVLRGTVYVYPTQGPAVHLRQTPDGRVLVGEWSQEYRATEVTEAHSRELLDQAGAAFPSLGRARIQQIMGEPRPIPRDGMPIVGSLPGIKSLYVAATHSGVTLAPVIARLAAQELVDGQPAVQLQGCRPARFDRRRPDVAQDVESAFEVPSEIFLG
ncbi:MAG: FAD-dependent oxidoreductase [Actinomycetota bacterium]